MRDHIVARETGFGHEFVEGMLRGSPPVWTKDSTKAKPYSLEAAKRLARNYDGEVLKITGASDGQA